MLEDACCAVTQRCRRLCNIFPSSLFSLYSIEDSPCPAKTHAGQGLILFKEGKRLKNLIHLSNLILQSKNEARLSPCLAIYVAVRDYSWPFLSLIAACAALRRAIGTRNGEQET